MSTKGQFFSTDFIVAVSIFLIAFTLLMLYWQSLKTTIDEKNEREDLLNTAYFVSQIWLSDGYPPYWNTDNVIAIGLQNDNRINQTKLDYLNQTGYDRFRGILGVSLYDIYFRMYN